MLEPVLGYAMKAMWIAFILYWIIAARGVKRTRWTEDWQTQLIDGTPIWIAAILLLAGHHLPAFLIARFVPASTMLAILGAVLTALGLGFAVWARLHLGRDWSPNVALKDEHALIRTGPYRVVRHPIYSGVLLALSGTALAVGEWRAALAFALLFLAFLRRVLAEEKRLIAIFPDYAQYRRETAALIPGLF